MSAAVPAVAPEGDPLSRSSELVAAHDAATSPTALPIGVLTPLTGPGDPVAGELVVRGAVLGARYVRENPGQFSGHQVRLVLCNDQETAHLEHMSRSAAGGFAKLALLDRVSAVIGQWHLRTTPVVASVAETLGVPTFVENGHNTATSGRKHVFRTYFSIADRAPLMASFAAAQGWKRIAVVAADTVFGQMLADTVVDACRDAVDGVVVHREDFVQEEVTDLDGPLSRVAAFGPDVLVNAGVVRTNYMVIDAARNAGLLPGTPMMACFPFPMRAADYWRGAGEAGAGVVWPATRYSPTWDGLTPMGQWFTQAYLEQFGSYPPDNSLNAFTDVTVLAQAAAFAGSHERRPLLAALESASFRTWRGTVRFGAFDEGADHHRPPEIVLQHYPRFGDDAQSAVVVWPPESVTGEYLSPALVGQR